MVNLSEDLASAVTVRGGTGCEGGMREPALWNAGLRPV